MATRIIRTSEDEILKKKCKPVNEINERILTLLDDMAETMYEANGVGLAAPQVGMLRRVVVIDVGDGLIELINPVILEQSGVQQGNEGCLSVPGKQGVVTRPDHVKVEAIDRDGDKFVMEGDGLLARAFCHEIDHLDGILYTDLVEGELEDVEYAEADDAEDEFEDN
jgi:peptide deformylase